MMSIRRSDERGATSIDWLKSKHSFSFGDYYDPANESFGALRVINEDWIKGGAGILVLVGRTALKRVGGPQRAVRSTQQTVAYLKQFPSGG
jgi:hypothetical protein